MNKFFKSLLNFIAYSDLFIGLLTASLITISKITFLHEIIFTSADFFIILSSVIAYNCTRIISKNESVQILTPYYYYFQIFILGAISLFFMLKINENNLLLFLIPLIIWLLYFIPFVFKRINFKIRNIALLKIFSISFVWTWLTLIVPLSGVNISPEILLVPFIARFFFIAAISVANDIFDIKQDKLSGTNTIPVILGKKISVGFIMAGLLFYLIFSDFAINNFSSTTNLLITLFSAALILLAIQVKEKPVSKLIADSPVFCQLIFVLIVYFN